MNLPINTGQFVLLGHSGSFEINRNCDDSMTVVFPTNANHTTTCYYILSIGCLALHGSSRCKAGLGS